jgi:hypothetical protein
VYTTYRKAAALIMALSATALASQGRAAPDRQDYLADYEQACRLIASRYVALEEKTGKSREAFLADCLRAGARIGAADPQGDFFRAMWELRSRIADGHLGWILPDGLRRRANFTLGLVPTCEAGRLVVGRVDPGLPRGAPAVGDEILEWDGLPAMEAVSRIARLMPQSSAASTAEVAARMLELSPRWSPLHDVAKPVRIVFREKGGNKGSSVLRWRENAVPLSAGGLPSLEDRPKEAVGLSDSLIAYPLTASGRRVAVLHPLEFDGWGAAELDRLLRLMDEWQSEALLIDMKDSSGGGFECVMELSRFLGIDRRLAFIQKEWDDGGKHFVETEGDFSSLAAARPRNKQWRGELLVRTNPVCGSACDYFAAWIKLNRRGEIIGQPSAGRGLGTDLLALDRTGTKIAIPVRDRIILPERLRIEGNPVLPDFPFEGSLDSLLAAYFSSRTLVR